MPSIVGRCWKRDRTIHVWGFRTCKSIWTCFAEEQATSCQGIYICFCGRSWYTPGVLRVSVQFLAVTCNASPRIFARAFASLCLCWLGVNVSASPRICVFATPSFVFICVCDFELVCFLSRSPASPRSPFQGAVFRFGMLSIGTACIFLFIC